MNSDPNKDQHLLYPNVCFKADDDDDDDVILHQGYDVAHGNVCLCSED